MNYISPDEKLHQSFVDVEPVTGKVLRRALRFQVDEGKKGLQRNGDSCFRPCQRAPLLSSFRRVGLPTPRCCDPGAGVEQTERSLRREPAVPGEVPTRGGRAHL